MSELIVKLNKYRHKHKLTIEELAVDLGVSWFTIYRWFRGIRNPSHLAEEKIEGYLKAKRQPQKVS